MIASDELIELTNDAPAPDRKDEIRRFELTPATPTHFRISVEVRTDSIVAVPGNASFILCNIEYEKGPIFWDTFLYPDTGTTPWRTLSCEVRARDVITCIELHIRFHARGKLAVRNLRVEPITDWPDNADCLVAMFGDSTDMTSYLPHELRVARRLELLLRDRFYEKTVDVRSFAEGGDFIKRLIDTGRLERELKLLPRCDVAMIRYGLNDKNQKVSPEDFGKQLHAACDLIGHYFPQAAITLSTTIPPLGDFYNPTTTAVAAARKLPLIPIDNLIRTRSASGDSDWHNGPGSFIGRLRTDHTANLRGDMHPNAWGAQMIAECYFEYLDPILAKRLGQ